MEIKIKEEIMAALKARVAMIEQHGHIVNSLKHELHSFIRQAQPELEHVQDVVVDLEGKVFKVGSQNDNDEQHK